MELTDLKVGDKVIRIGWSTKDVATVVNITPSGMIDIKLNERVTERYNKDGSLRGSSNNRWNRLIIRNATKEEIERIRLDKEKAKIVNFLRNFKFHELPNEKLRKIIEILESEE